MRIVIAGAGRGGLSLAVHLQKADHEVTILERDAEIAAMALEGYGIVSLRGDATDAVTLRQAEPQRADALIAMLRRDADNLAVAMLARSLGASRVMVRMRDPEYREVYASAGVDQVLSETEVLVGAFATAIEFHAVRHSMILGSGDAIAFELALPSDARVVGQSVREVAAHPSFPRSCVIAGIERQGQVEAPRGATQIEGEGRLLLVAARADLARTVDFFLERATKA